MNWKDSWMRRTRRTFGGVHAPHRKYTSGCETLVMPPPERITLLMAQHLGAPCIPTVKVGDTVAVGQVVGDSDHPLSAPVHSGVSGTVSAITEVLMPTGKVSTAVVIDSDGEQRLYENIQPPKVETFKDFIQAVRASGLIGLGGAGFPTHVKLNPKNRDEINTILINAAECEPYLTADYRECMENSWNIVSGLQTVMEFLDAKEVVIAIEDNKPMAIKELSRIAKTISTTGREVRVCRLPARYPQGAEKVLIAACTGKRVPPGKLPADVGCVVMNVTSVAFIAQYLKTGMPLISKRLTVDGSAMAHPKNVRATVGTPLREVIAFAGGTKKEPKKLMLGGPMMGLALKDDAFPVLKNTNGLVVLSEEDVSPIEPSACIRCGKCVAACPMRLVPPALAQAHKRGDIEALQKGGMMSCMECGCCSFSCPAHRPIVQVMRLAKAAVRNSGNK